MSGTWALAALFHERLRKSAMEQSQRLEMRAFVCYVNCSKKGDDVLISLGLSHKDPNLEQPPLMAEMVDVCLTDAEGRAWRCTEEPRGQLIATTGPGTVSHARYVFQRPTSASVAKTLVVSVVDSATAVLDGA